MKVMDMLTWLLPEGDQWCVWAEVDRIVLRLRGPSRDGHVACNKASASQRLFL